MKYLNITEIRLLVERFAIRQLGAMNRRALSGVEKVLDSQHGITVPQRFRDKEEKFARFTQFADFHLQLVEAAEGFLHDHLEFQRRRMITTLAGGDDGQMRNQWIAINRRNCHVE